MSTTVKAIRRALAGELDDGGVYTITSATTTTVTASLLVNAAANASANRYDGRWLWISAPAGQSRAVSTGGYTPSGGVLAFSPAWTAPSAGAELDITGLFPVQSNALSEDTDYFTLIERALAKLLVPRRVTLAITTADSYSLALWPWLDREERLLRVLEPALIAGRQPFDAAWRGARFVRNGGTNLLVCDTPFGSASGSLTLETLAPAHTWVDDVEVDPSVGITFDVNTVDIEVEDVLPQAMVEACVVLTSRSSGRPNGDWSKNLAFWQGEAKKARFYDHTRDRETGQPAPAEAA